MSDTGCRYPDGVADRIFAVSIVYLWTAQCGSEQGSDHGNGGADGGNPDRNCGFWRKDEFYVSGRDRTDPTGHLDPEQLWKRPTAYIIRISRKRHSVECHAMPLGL